MKLGTRTHARRVMMATMAVAVPLVVALAATSADAQTASSPPQFATGTVTSVHGASVQVDNATQNTESTVSFSSSTTFQKRESATSSVIAVGDCVRVNGKGSAAKGITASTVAVSAATANGCTGGFGGRAGPGGGGTPPFGGGQRPNFGSGQRPSGGSGPAAGAQQRLQGAAFGPVVSISGDHLTVKATTVTPPKKKGAKPKTTTKAVTVKLSSSTTITQTVAAAASDVTVGSCVTATGTSAAGGVTASSVTVSQPVNGACGGFGGRGGGGFGGGAGNGTGGTSGATQT
jgi:hypothetical protein